MRSQEIFDLLTKEYTLKLAISPEDFEAVKTIRKEVFSQKYSMSPDYLEKMGYLFNEDDKQSFIYFLLHNETNTYVGTVRIFFLNQRTPITQLPMQKDGNVKDIDQLMNTLPVVELSRGAIIQNLPPHHTYSSLQLRVFIRYQLMIATRINFLLYSYKTIFSIMEPSLHRFLRSQKIYFEQIGKPVEYYGTRTPYAIDRKKLIQDTEINMEELTRHYLKELCKDPKPFWQFIDANPYLERSDIQLDRICQLFKKYGDDVDLSLLLGEEKS